jgi:hypothetical protein
LQDDALAEKLSRLFFEWLVFPRRINLSRKLSMFYERPAVASRMATLSRVDIFNEAERASPTRIFRVLSSIEFSFEQTKQDVHDDTD